MQEASARVRTNVFLRDLNVAVPPGDERRIEVIVSGLPVYGGSQLAIDITMRSPLHADGSHKTAADWEDGATAKRVRGDKERNYPELTVDGRCRYVVLPIETGGRFGQELSDFRQQLAAVRALTAP